MAESNSQPVICPCGFFGSAQTLGLCSKCYRESGQMREQRSLLTNSDLRAHNNSNNNHTYNNNDCKNDTFNNNNSSRSTDDDDEDEDDEDDEDYDENLANADLNLSSSLSFALSESSPPTSSPPSPLHPSIPSILPDITYAMLQKNVNKSNDDKSREDLPSSSSSPPPQTSSPTSPTSSSISAAASSLKNHHTTPQNHHINPHTHSTTPHSQPQMPDKNSIAKATPTKATPATVVEVATDNPANNQSSTTPTMSSTTTNVSTTMSSTPTSPPTSTDTSTIVQPQEGTSNGALSTPSTAGLSRNRLFGFPRPQSDSMITRTLKRTYTDAHLADENRLEGEGARGGGGGRSKKKCYMCNVKLDLAFQAIGRCKCEFTFCSLHRLPEQHQCSFDHKESSRKEARTKMVLFKKHVGTALKRLDNDL